MRLVRSGPILRRVAADGLMARCEDFCKSRGSASELEYHLLLARDLHMLDADEAKNAEQKVLEVQRMLAALVQRLHGPVLARS